jgi:hypothetical protein
MDFEILAEVEVLKVHDCECKARFVSGARPMISYKELGGSLSSCAIYLGDKKEAYPGEKLEIALGFLNPELHQSLMYVGLEFGLYAGPWKIAKGKVVFL